MTDKNKGKKHLIVVIEESRLSAQRIKKALPPAEFDVCSAKNPYSAIEKIATSDPALIIISTEFGWKPTHMFSMKLALRDYGVLLLDPKMTKAQIIRATRYGVLDVMNRPPHQGEIRKRIHGALLKSGKILPAASENNEDIKLDIPKYAKTPRERVDYVIEKAVTLLALPHAVSTVLRLSSRPNTSANDLVRPVKSDAAMATSIFRSANSVASGSAHKVTDVRNAIARLGMRETANLAITHSVFGMFDKGSGTFGFDRTEYWIHSLGTACCARELASKMEGVQPDNAFLAGLLHDIGKMVLDEYLSVEYQDAVKCANLNVDPLRFGERTKLDADHCYVGDCISEQWKLPDHMRMAIADHHKYAKLIAFDGAEGDDNKAHIAVTRCVCLANQLAKAYELGHAGDFVVEEDALELWAELEGAEFNLEESFLRIRESLLEYLSMLRITSEELHLRLEEASFGKVLIMIPEGEPRYHMLLEAFYTQAGYDVETQLESDGLVDGECKPYAVAVTSVSGDLDDAKKKASELFRYAAKVVVFSDSLDVAREGTHLGSEIVILRRVLDFYALRCALKDIDEMAVEDCKSEDLSLESQAV